MKAFPVPHFFFTVDVEEWFASKLIKTTPEEQEAVSDLDEAMDFILALLKEKKIKGTFFYLFHTAKKYPEVVRKTLAEGHEVALHGYKHDNILDLGETEFFKMLKTMKHAFKSEFGVDLKGYRAPHFGRTDRLAPLLKEAGFVYDTSIMPCLPIPGWYGDWKASKIPYRDRETQLWELPISVQPYIRLPGGGGYYFRNLGRYWTTHVLHAGLNRHHYAMFYIHPWEVATKNPIHRPGVPFYTFRRTGTWARENLSILLDQVLRFPEIECKSIKDILKF